MGWPESYIIPLESEIHAQFLEAAASKRILFFAGIPGVGKSLMLQQFATLALHQGRRIHLLQWDVARAAFETPDIMARYPEIDGLTHAAIRMAAGLWARGAIKRWSDAHQHVDELLIGELPLVGNRLIEICHAMPQDPAEAVLAASSTGALIPVPSLDIRQKIEAARAASIANPSHEREKYDAPPNVLRLNWRQVQEAALALEIETDGSMADGYDPLIYQRTFLHLLRHRRPAVLSIDVGLKPAGSVYDLTNVTSELAPTAEEVAATISKIDSITVPDQFEALVGSWYDFP